MSTSSRPKISKHARLKRQLTDALTSRFSGEIAREADVIVDVVLSNLGIDAPKDRVPEPPPTRVPETVKKRLREAWMATTDKLNPIGIYFASRKGKIYCTIEWTSGSGYAHNWYIAITGVVKSVVPSAVMTSGGGFAQGRATFRLNP